MTHPYLNNVIFSTILNKTCQNLAKLVLNPLQEQQFHGLQNIHDKLSSDMETIMNDREAMRRETRNLRREVHESQQFADKLQKEKRDLSNEMDLLIRSRSEFNNNSNNQESISNIFGEKFD